MLRGRLSGYTVGLVQLFRDVPCPDLLARHLLDLELDDWRDCARSYMRHLVLRREEARVNWETEEVEQLDVEIHEHAIHEQIPKRWGLVHVFSEAYHGDSIFAFWAEALIHLCTLEGYWLELLGGMRPTDPHTLPGFHSDEEVCSTAWLEDYRRIWATELTTPSLAERLCSERQADE